MNGGGVIEGLQVQAQTSPTMTIVVGQGSALIPTGAYPSSWAYEILNDTTSGSPAGETVTIGTAPTSNSRIDTVVAYVNTSYTTGTTDNPGMWIVTAVQGTVASSPVAPSNSTIQSAVGASNPYIKLANVTVGTNVTQITNANIADARVFGTLSSSVAISPTNTTANSASAWVWQTWSPALTNITVGNGTLTGRYIQNGKHVTAVASLQTGSTTAFNAGGTYIISLPVTARTPGTVSSFGTWLCYDSVGGYIYFPGMLQAKDANSCYLLVSISGGTAGNFNKVTGANSSNFTPPLTGSGTYIEFRFSYEAA